MKEQEKSLLLNCAVILLCAFALGVICGYKYTQKPPTIAPIEKVDTLVIRDTITQTEPVFVRERIVDTMMVAVTDTIVRNDTTFVYLPKQQREYDNPQFKAWVSGYDPKLDSIHLYQTTKVVTKDIPVKVRSKWGIGIQAGYGASEYGLTPYIGVGVSYNILSW